MPRMEQHYAGPGGWSKWTIPVMKQYRMACCDCGLVHDLDFRVLKVTSRKNSREFWGERVPGMRVEFRARRNNRSTAQIRRSMKFMKF